MKTDEKTAFGRKADTSNPSRKTWKDYAFYGFIGLMGFSTLGSVGKILEGPSPPAIVRAAVPASPPVAPVQRELPPAPAKPKYTYEVPRGGSYSRPDATGYGVISQRTGKPRTQYVRGYTRKDGTRVKPYYRSRR